MTSSFGNIFCVTVPLHGGSTGHRWIPLKMPVMQSFDVSLICASTSGWANNQNAGELRRDSVDCHVSVQSNKGFSQVQLQVSVRNNVGSFFIGTRENNFDWTWIKIQYIMTIDFKKSSVKWRPFCFGFNVSISFPCQIHMHPKQCEISVELFFSFTIYSVAHSEGVRVVRMLCN